MSYFWRIFDQIILAIQLAAYAGILVSVGGQIFFRNVLDRPLEFPEEISVFLLLGIVFFGASVVERRDEHLRVDMLYFSMPTPLKLVVSILSAIFALACVTVLLFGEWILMNLAGGLRSSAARIPLWWVHTALLAACLLWMVVLAYKLFFLFRRTR